jgi:hypothetical protein
MCGEFNGVAVFNKAITSVTHGGRSNKPGLGAPRLESGGFFVHGFYCSEVPELALVEFEVPPEAPPPEPAEVPPDEPEPDPDPEPESLDSEAPPELSSAQRGLPPALRS